MELKSSLKSGWDRTATTGRRLLDRYYGTVTPYRLSRGDKLTAIIPVLFFFLLFLFTCSHNANIGGDSPELIGGAYSLGIVHPPGYPTYTMLGYIVSHIPVGSIAFRMNFLSVISHTVTLLILFIIFMKITRNRLASLITVFILGISYLFWFYSLLAEVFPVNDFLAVLLILLAMLVRDRWLCGNERGSQRLFILLVFLCGLSLTHHQTIVLIFPVLILITLHPLLEIFKRPRYLLYCIAVFLLGLLPYVYLPIRASSQPYINFGDPSSFGRFFNVVSRRVYGSTRLWIGPAASHRLDLVFDFLRTLDGQVYLAGIFLGIVGMYQMARKRMGDFLPLMTGLLLTAVVFPLMANVSLRGSFEVSTIERFYLLPTIIFCCFLAYGLDVLLTWIKKAISLLKIRDVLKGALVVAAILLIILPFALPFRTTLDNVSLSNDVIGEAYIENLLSPIEDGSLLILSGDIDVELVDFYYKACYEEQRDVITIIWSFWGFPWYMDHLRHWYPELNLPENPQASDLYAYRLNYYKGYMLEYLIANNPQIPNIYSLLKDLGVERAYELLPYCLYYKMQPLDEQIDYGQYAAFQVDYFNNLDRRGLDYTLYTDNRRESHLVQLYSLYMNEVVSVLHDNGYLEEASLVCSLAFETYPYREYEWEAAEIFMEMGNLDEAEALFRDYADRGSYFDERMWQALINIEEIQELRGAE